MQEASLKKVAPKARMATKSGDARKLACQLCGDPIYVGFTAYMTYRYENQEFHYHNGVGYSCFRRSGLAKGACEKGK